MSIPIVDVEQDAVIPTVWTMTYWLGADYPRTLTLVAPHRDAAVAKAVDELAERYSAPPRSWAPWAA